MATWYLEELSSLMEKIGVGKGTHNRLQCQHFFSGVACYVDNKIFASLTPVGFALKLPEKYRDELIKERGVKLLQYFPKAPIKKEYAVLSKRVLENKNQLKKLVDESIKYVLSLKGRKH